MGMPGQGSKEGGHSVEDGGACRQVQRGLTVGRTGLVGLAAGVLTCRSVFSHKITSQDRGKPGSECQPFLFD